MENFDLPIQMVASARENLFEPDFLKSIFTEDNISDWVKWFHIMDRTILSNDDLLDLANSYFQDAILSEETDEVEQALKSLSLAIRISPRGTSLISCAYIKRGKYLMDKKCYKNATADFYQALIESEDKVPLCTESFLGKIKTCLFALNDDSFARCILLKISKCIEQFKQLNTKPNADRKALCKRFLLKAIDELDKIKLQNIENTENNKYFPYMGYTTLYPKIKQFSVACSYLRNTKIPRILANRTIPEGETIAIESPYNFEYLSLNIQCDYCQSIEVSFIPCSECHMGTYCSILCKEADDYYHKYECKGMKMMAIPLMDCKLLLRLLIRGLTYLKLKVLHDDVVKFIKSSDLYLYIMDKSVQNEAIEYFNILNFDPKYEQLSMEDFRHCVSMALRLTIYIRNYTTIIEDFFPKLQDTSEIDLFIATLIMRHTAQMKTKSFLINFDISEIIENNNKNTDLNFESKNDIQFHQKFNLIENDFSDYRLKDIYAKLQIFLNQKITNLSNEKLDSIPNLRSAQLIYPVKWFEDFVNHKFLNCLIYSHEKYQNQNGKHSKQNQFESTLKLFVQEMYKFNHYKVRQSKQTMKTIFPCLSLMNHSCDPNVVLCLSPSGAIIAKTMKEIAAGEEITISYGAHYKKASNKNRHQYLKEKLVNCECKHCIECNNATTTTDYFQLQTYMDCEKCNTGMVNPCDFICQSCECKTEKSDIIVSLLLSCKRLQDVIATENNTKGKILAAHILVLMISMEIWGKQKYPVYIQMLEMGEYLAKENYIFDAYEFFNLIKVDSLKYYPAMTYELYADYEKMFISLIAMLKNNFIEDSKYAEENDAIFKRIFKLTNEIGTDMEKITKVFMIDNQMANNLNTNMKTLNLLAEKINKIKENPAQNTNNDSRGFLRILFDLPNEKLRYLQGSVTTNDFMDILENTMKNEREHGKDAISECIQIDSSIYYNTNVKFNWCDEMDSD